MQQYRHSYPTIDEYRSLSAHPARISGGSSLIHDRTSHTQAEGPLVSIVTPVRNSAHTLSQTITSVLAQTYPHIEYIVIDGGSTDGALDVLHAFNKGIDVWISEPDGGISDAFNKGVACASGEIIGILNADDWYEPATVAKVVDAFAAREVDLVCGALQYWEGEERGLVFYSNPDNLPLESTVNHPTVFVRKYAYESLGLFSREYRYAMDYDLLLRFYMAGVRFRVLPDVLANMRFGGRSDSAVYPVSKELYQIKTYYLGRPYRQVCYSAYHYTRTRASKLLRRLGVDGILDHYRDRHSVVKKSR